MSKYSYRTKVCDNCKAQQTKEDNAQYRKTHPPNEQSREKARLYRQKYRLLHSNAFLKQKKEQERAEQELIDNTYTDLDEW